MIGKIFNEIEIVKIEENQFVIKANVFCFSGSWGGGVQASAPSHLSLKLKHNKVNPRKH